MNFKFYFASLFVYFACTAATAQELKRVDSLALFTINEDELARGQGLLQTKGFVSSILPIADGYQVNVFKQYWGYLTIDKATAPKGLASTKQSLPGMAQISYSPIGLKVEKEKIFSLTRTLVQPFGYKHWEITSIRGGVSTATKKILSEDETAGDYARLLTAQPQALNFTGLNKTVAVFYRPNVKEVEFFKQPAVFEPYNGRYAEDASRKTSSQKKTMQVDGKIPVSFQTEDYAVLYLKPVEKGVLTTIRIDSTLKETQMEKLSIPEDFGILSYAEARKQTTKEIFGFNSALERDGFAILVGNAATDRKKGNKYTLLRFDLAGKLVYRHDFQMDVEDFMFDGVKIMVNDQETILKLNLRKGLKFQLYYLKIDKDGLKYKTQWERSHEKTLKVYTSEGKAESGGSHEDSFVISLPDGISLLYGADYGMGAPGGPLKGYGFTQLAADGKIAAYFNANTLMPPNMPSQGLDFRVINIGEGRLVLIAKEPRDNSALTLQKYSLLERDFSDTYNLVAKKTPELSINLEKLPQEQLKTGNKFLDKVANAAINGVTSDFDVSKRVMQIESDPVGYTTALYFINTKNPEVKRINLNWKGGYNFPFVENIWVNTGTREIDTFLRVPERPFEIRKNGLQFPRGVMLQAVKVGF
ncbi:MAG: hypothetical protein U0V04_05845 [Spirosomataceae bacterium]|jgi:hypothetical protein